MTSQPERIEERFHAEWLGMVQPTDGLVVSIPVLVEAQAMSRQPPALQERLRELTASHEGELAFADFTSFAGEILGWPGDVLTSDLPLDLAPQLSLDVPEGHQTLRPTHIVRGESGAPPLALVWEVGPEVASFDRPETRTGPWEYPLAAKLDRLLRHTRVPIGLLTNRTHVRLVYAPHGESSGSITFRLADMATVGGRPILDALVMLLGANRLWHVAPERQLPAMLAESRKRQANVTNELADQVKAALAILLRGFEAAAERDGHHLLDDARRHGPDHLYGGLLTQLLRLVFVLYAEDRGLLPVDHPLYAENLSVLGLFAELQADHGAHPDSMARRFGAYGRLTSLFRALYLGVSHGDLRIPARRGDLFSPHTYPFLEGWHGEPGSAPIVDPIVRAETRVPSVDDETVFRVLEKLLFLDHQRLSYRALDVEQIGSVYEALMGHRVIRLDAPAVCVRPARVWLAARELLDEKPALRARWIQAQTGLAKAQAEKVTKAIAGLKKEDDVLAALEPFSVTDRSGGEPRADAGRHVIQPGPERRRTSSHYTPRSLTAPIVEKTLRPLLRAMGEHPPSERILNLKICDPAMGSGAFLVEACRFLADELVSAWTREGKRELVGGTEDVVLVARRLVAQRCLYGVDKNPFAVSLAKLSLWLVTLAKDLPFTFLDHALRHGDSLVGLSFDQITAFHWKPAKQLELCRKELTQTLDEAVHARQKILDLAADPSPSAQKEKEWLLKDADDALARVRLLGDLIVGAFFSSTKDKEREKERLRRLDRVTTWLQGGESPPQELIDLQAEVRSRTPALHWMAEYPEIFWAKRPDPLSQDRIGGHAWIDGFVGNPPFLGGGLIGRHLTDAYQDWLQTYPLANGNADLCAYFFRRSADLLGDAGTLGLLATNTIGQGDTRNAGLQPLISSDCDIYEAVRSFLWPGTANVAVSTICVAKGLQPTLRTLDGIPVNAISSRLRPHEERPDPVPLASNQGLSFKGVFFLGSGFLFEDGNPEASPLAKMRELIAKNPQNSQRILPFLGGEELNSSPTLQTTRFIIDFDDMPLSEAERWPDLLDIVRQRVKPLRDRTKVAAHRDRWWQFASRSAALRAAVKGLPRCLVTAQVTKHLCFAFQVCDQVFSQKVYVFPFSDFTQFAVLQSRIHNVWVRLLSATMKEDISYTTTDCFDNFPFPRNDPRDAISGLEAVGRQLYEARASYMIETGRGLTQTYNWLKDSSCDDAATAHLRSLHMELDAAVLAAYGWRDVAVASYRDPQARAEHTSLDQFETAILDRLFVLNAERAAIQEAIPLTQKLGRKPNLLRSKGTNAHRRIKSAHARNSEE